MNLPQWADILMWFFLIACMVELVYGLVDISMDVFSEWRRGRGR